MYEVATRKREACVQVIRTWDEFDEALTLAPWCDEKEVEKDVKARTTTIGETGAARTLCSPFEQPELPEGKKDRNFLFRNLCCFEFMLVALERPTTCKEGDLFRGQELLSS
ncbi:unnamed protein product [Eruca vesicaria subsp. sativa]|uniref:Proline-tRNA ligase class II C-terminal domain-containing protein n=1 Tax=Eruca vesicaria subsp. sativa TaxID=29727 RepID=A0ABC8KWY6_ERUVS|nr:unnamed protein product [Eruca vesicaria subsp. sativa]